jgi:tetratricopeptide (TPR) repeat protein
MAVLLVWVVFGIDALGLFGKRNTQQVTHNPASRPVPRPNEANSNPVDPQLPAAKTPDGAVAGGSSKPFSANSTPANPPSDVPSTPENPFQQVLDPTDPAAPSSASPPTSPAATPPETAPSSPASPPRSKRKSKSRPPGFSNPPSNTPGVVNPPAAPPAAANPPTAVDPPATAAVPDPASKPPEMRHPVPSAADQRAKFDEFKSLYSKEFEDAERPPAREKFPDFLIAKADVIKSDPVARFAILREAYNRLIAAKDFATAVELVDRLEEEYQVDALAMRTHTLTKASTAGRQTAAEKQALVLCAADLAEIALRRQRMTQALELSRMADNLSKALQNKPLRDRTIALKEEVEKAQAQWGPVERARQVLATSPDDAAAALVDGRYRCLVAGDWATGIPVLAKGGSDPLAIAARLDLAGAADSKSAATIADAWYELARSDEKLKPLYARALHWYRQAVATSTGADQVPWLQRVELIEGLNLPERYFAAVHDAKASEPLPAFFAMFFRNVSFEPIDCFKFVVPLELKASPWNAYPGSSASIYSKPDIVYGKVPTHVPNIPREYQVGVRVSQYYSSGQAGPFVVGVAGPRSPFAVVIDMPIGTEFCTFITLADAKTPEQNPTLVRYARQHLMFGDVPVLVQVRRGSVTVQIDNQPVTQYEGDLDKLVSPPDWTIPRFNGLLLGAHQGSYRVSSWFLEPVAPAPRTAKASAPPPVPGVPGFPPSP